VYVKAVYPSLSASEPASEAIIWDAILAGPSAPWDQRHFVHPDPAAKNSKTKSKTSRLPKVSKKKAAQLAKAAPKAASPFPAGELHLATQRPKYQITDVGGKLQNRTDVVLQVGWNVQPWVGALTWTNWETVGVWKGFVGGKSEAFQFPEIGKKTVVDKKDLETEKGTEGYRLVVGEEQPLRKAGKV
jgi:signal peptidase complex subunit 3